jgi:hypothetical protein
MLIQAKPFKIKHIKDGYKKIDMSNDITKQFCGDRNYHS